MPATGSQKGAPEFNWKPFVSSSTIPPDHTKPLYMCLQGEKKPFFDYYFSSKLQRRLRQGSVMH